MEGYEAGAAEAWKYLCEAGAFAEESRGAWLEATGRELWLCAQKLSRPISGGRTYKGREEGGLPLSPFSARRFRCGPGLWVGPVGALVPPTSLLPSLWLSAQMVIRWLLGTEQMAFGSTEFLQVPKGGGLESLSLERTPAPLSLPSSGPRAGGFLSCLFFSSFPGGAGASARCGSVRSDLAQL